MIPACRVYCFVLIFSRSASVTFSPVDPLSAKLDNRLRRTSINDVEPSTSVDLLSKLFCSAVYSKSLAALSGDSAVPLAQTLRSHLNILRNRVSWFSPPGFFRVETLDPSRPASDDVLQASTSKRFPRSVHVAAPRVCVQFAPDDIQHRIRVGVGVRSFVRSTTRYGFSGPSCSLIHS